MNIKAMALFGSTILATSLATVQRAEAVDYVVTDAASCLAFAAGIGTTADASFMPICYIEGGILPAQDSVTFAADTTFRPQTDAFTNLGVIIINSTDFGFYAAAFPFTNQGTINIIAGTNARFGGRFINEGEIISAVDIYNGTSGSNGNTFTNTCTGTITGNVVGAPVIQEACPLPPVAQAVPTLSIWGLGLLASVLGFVGIRNRRK